MPGRTAMPQEGKTSFAASFARLSARDGQNVLLVEGDLRRPKIGALFRGDHWRPWQDALTGSESIDRFIGTVPDEEVHRAAVDLQGKRPGAVSPQPAPGDISRICQTIDPANLHTSYAGFAVAESLGTS